MLEKWKQYFRDNPLGTYEKLGLLVIYGGLIVVTMLLLLGHPALHP